MTVLVTGAAGHVGANLVRTLVDRGNRVRALIHRNRDSLEGLDVEAVPGDVRDPVSLANAIRGVEVVYHLAADISLSMNNWLQIASVNINGTRNVVEACLQNDVRRLVHLSSIHAMSQEPLNIPVDESRQLVNSSKAPPYDRSKAEGEREVRRGIEAGLDAVIINPTAIVGPYDYQPSHFGSALIDMARGKLPALVDGGFDWVDVRDVVGGLLQAEQKAPAGSKYLLSGHWLSVCEVAAIVREMTGADVPGFVCPMWLAKAGAPIMSRLKLGPDRRPLYTKVTLKALCSNRVISHNRANDELGYEPRPFSQTIADTLGWFKEAGQLPSGLEIKPLEAV